MQSCDVLESLIEGRFADPETGQALRTDTRDIRIAESLEGMEAALVGALGLGDRIGVVDDPDTHAVLGKRVAHALRSVARVKEIRLDRLPHADRPTADAIRDAADGMAAIVAVGSGTINDLCKFASHALGIPYVVFGTAPSMNGYLSANAAITEHGHKKSLSAHVPAAAFFDLRVMADAPVRMIRSGLGDSLCRPTAQSDWLLARGLLDQPYRRVPFDLLAEDEDDLFAQSEALVRRDVSAMERLVRTLVLSGLGMTLCGSSHPASEGEHLISHYIDMMASPARGDFFHGEQVGVTTLTMAAVQERLLDGPAPRIEATVATRDDVIAHFGAETGAECWEEFARKRIDPATVDAFNETLAARWDDIRSAIDAVRRPAGELRRVLERAGAPTEPESIGCSRPFYRDAVLHARELRNRFTFLDLAGDAGALVDFADAAPGRA